MTEYLDRIHKGLYEVAIKEIIVPVMDKIHINLGSTIDEL